MTMASVLKVTANGTTTSPVLRGHWITERILGIETRPPPPTVKAVEPDIRGAVTIRQQLAKHRDNPSCASCHVKMDPPGFALESFDVMGARRERYRAVAENMKSEPGFGLNGQAFAFHYGLPVDSAGELPDGRTFHDIREFKRLISGDELSVARNLAKQLVTFATGAPVRFTDRDELERILVLRLLHQLIVSILGAAVTMHFETRIGRQADERVAPEPLAALNGFEQIRPRTIGELEVDGQRSVEVGEGFQHQRDTRVTLGRKLPEIRLGHDHPSRSEKNGKTKLVSKTRRTRAGAASATAPSLATSCFRIPAFCDSQPYGIDHFNWQASPDPWPR